MHSSNSSNLATIAETSDDIPLPPPRRVSDDEIPLPPPPLSLRRGSIPPLPGSPPKIITGRKSVVSADLGGMETKQDEQNVKQSGSRPSTPKTVPGSKIRRATQSFIDDPMMASFQRPQQSSKGGSAPAAGDDVKDIGRDAVDIDKEETDMQMLRGIFAAFDENKNGKLNRRELSDALVALGFKPTESLMSKYYTENLSLTGKKSWNISLTAFVNASLKHLDSADDCTNDVMYLFKAFDTKLSGDVTAKMVRHFLHETIVPSRLSSQETDEFLLECMQNPTDLSEIIKYEDLVDKLLFGNNK